MKNPINNIRINLERLRKEQGKSQIGLSKESGVASIMVCRLEGGQYKNISIKTLNKIAKALNVPLIELLK
jgi:transcriptional regulator with XRE-family HTH domain